MSLWQSRMIDEARETGRGKNIVVEILKCTVLAVGITTIVQIIAAVVAIITGLGNNDDYFNLLLLWIQLLGIVFFLLFCKYVEKRPITSMGFVKNDFWKQYLKGAAVGFGMFASVIIIGTLTGAFRFVGLNKDVNIIMLLFLLGGFMIQGMFEEVVFRGFFMVSASRKSSIIVAIITNSVVFALIHGGNNGFSLIAFINLILFSIYVSLYMLKTDNIWGIGALHGVWNFVQGCFFGLRVSGMPLGQTVFVFEQTEQTWANGGAFGPEGGLLVTVVLIVEIAAMLLPCFKVIKKTKQ